MSNYKIREVLGSKMCLLENDPGISRKLIYSRKPIREVGSTKETIRLLKKGMTIIDIGANLGYYALLEARIIGKRGFVYAIEPVPENVKALRKSIILNKYKNIKVYEIAISSLNGKQELILSHKSNCATLIKRSKNLNLPKNSMMVKVKTLNKFCKDEQVKRIDFLRMDVEGGEVEIVKGMSKIIKLMPKGAILNMEIHPKAYGKLFKPIIKMLNTLKTYRFKVKKYILRDKIIELNSYEELISLLDNKYCPQVFFERN